MSFNSNALVILARHRLGSMGTIWKKEEIKKKKEKMQENG
jgi:hypothetical protein